MAMGQSGKVPNTFNLKLLLLLSLVLFIFYLLVAHPSSPPQTATASDALPSCGKIPPSLADAIVHYATLNNTPQQTAAEIAVTARVLERRSPCNFLVFGLGHDSLMWRALNHGGRTVFLEEDASWIDAVRRHVDPALEAYHVSYGTKLREADELLGLASSEECAAVEDLRHSKCRLTMRELPRAVYEVEWDVIMVDAPTGYHAEAPGRMVAIYTAGMAARWRRWGETDVVVHDVDRNVEDEFSRAFLCEGYMRHEEGRLRHFVIPSHRDKIDVDKIGVLPLIFRNYG